MDEFLSNCELFLYFSYLPKFSEANLEWFNCDFDNHFGEGVLDKAWWINEGVRALRETISSQVGSTPEHATHIIPLSGGLDSRVIFGGLLENLPHSQIIAVTYGIPGSWDYEIPKIITKKFSIEHEVFNLLEEKWDLDQLLKAAVQLNKPINVYQSYVRQKVTNHFGPDCIYWSGFMGDALGGIDHLELPITEKREAVRAHLKEFTIKNYQNRGFQEALVNRIVAEVPWAQLDQKKFSLYQQLYFGVKEYQLTRNIVILDGFNFKTPFLDKRWVNFITNVPNKWLVYQHLYRNIVHACYRELAKIPVSTTAGMPVAATKYQMYLGKAIAKIQPYLTSKDPHRSHPRTNYVNWAESLRQKGHLQNAVRETLEAFKRRSIFKNEDLEAWWFNHLNRKKDHAALLMNLSSLELLLQAGVM